MQINLKPNKFKDAVSPATTTMEEVVYFFSDLERGEVPSFSKHIADRSQLC